MISNNTVKSKVPYMCMICRVCVLRTNKKHFLHLSDGGTDKHRRKILSKFRRYCNLYHCQLNSTSYINNDRVISTVCLPFCCRCCQNRPKSAVRISKKIETKKMDRKDGGSELRFTRIKQYFIS